MTNSKQLSSRPSPEGAGSDDRSDRLTLTGVRENNLKDLNLTIPHDRLVTVTGLSGSGKSTLAIDTIYAEGGRRYIETFSPYTRQFLDRLHQPELDAMHGVRPALALEQRNRVTSSRSTVGTSTEINDYLKTIWAHVSEPYCERCNAPVTRDRPRSVLRTIVAEMENEASETEQLLLTFPVALTGAASGAAVADTFRAEGFVRGFDVQRNLVVPLDELVQQVGGNSATIYVIVDRFRGKLADSERERLMSGINQCYTYGHGSMVAVRIPQDGRLPILHAFHETLRCNGCGTDFRDPKPYMFSFNSPLGACPTCHGFGRVLTVDPTLCIPDPRKTIAQGAVSCWATDSTKHEFKKLRVACELKGVSLDTPWHSLPESHRKFVMDGSSDRTLKFKGVRGWFDRLQSKRHKMHVRIFLARYRREQDCPDCHGTRIRPEALAYRINGMTLPEVWQLPLKNAVDLFERLAYEVGATASSGNEIVEISLEEIQSRLQYLVQIGLGYLTLDRQTRTLSGGESQRVNLTTILGSRLVNTILVLDEPTIGLHPTDTDRLIETMHQLRDRGNSVIVVEHDAEVIRASDEVIDIGPGSGSAGGDVVFQGTPAKLAEAANSLTGQYLNGKSWVNDQPLVPADSRSGQKKPRKDRAVSRKESAADQHLIVRGACAHNLRDIDVKIPLNRLVTLTGVSGSGKSSFVNLCLDGPYRRIALGSPPESLFAEADSTVRSIEGLEHLGDIILIDQSPVGKTPRANPATYSKAWDIIRDCLAETPAAEALGLSRSAFSFNVDGGRCPDCSGAGYQRIEMQFLADVFVQCESCGGSRFQDKVLSVTYAGKNVVELLDLTLDETVNLFRSLGESEREVKVVKLLEPLIALGLGYLRLGHPLSLLSGGEAQRLKLASYLREDSKKGVLFILDEPTTGLHPFNVAQLLNALRALIANGHSVLCVEHNTDVISNSDWLIDLGPGAGEDGGMITVEGEPDRLISDDRAHIASSTVRCLREAKNPRRALARVASSADRTPAVMRLPAKQEKAEEPRTIEIVGARHHNLQNVSVNIAQNQLTVVTGVSGSGKSSLAFDILFAEGQRRYIDCLSPYARQYIKQLSRAEVDRVASLPPTIAISQKTSPPLGISTVATVTELYQFLRLLFSKVGDQHCPHDDTRITSLSAASLVEELRERYQKQRVHIFAPVVQGRKGFYNDLINRALRAEIAEARIDGRIVSLEPEMRLERHKLHWISLLVGSIAITPANTDMIRSAIEHALLLGGGTIEVAVGKKDEEPIVFSSARACPTCQRGFRPLDPQDFSFRSSRGVCGKCSGRGFLLKKDDTPGASCPECEGARIGPIGRHVYIEGRSIHSLVLENAPRLLAWLRKLSFPRRLDPIVGPVLKELTARLEVVINVGLDYLTLDRDASTISGGEAQRLRLAKALGSPLSGVCYILDEPSIGLHPQDQTQLMRTLDSLRDGGNTVVVVEHDEGIIRRADQIIDIGPRGGAGGGELVAQGSLDEIERCERSVTGQALRTRTGRSVQLNDTKFHGDHPWIELAGATTNNLQSVSVKVPLRSLTVVSGVSGAGKSSLVHGTLVPAILAEFEGKKKKRGVRPSTWDTVTGTETLQRMIEIDQAPVGKTNTSTPASYLGIFDDIRKLYAQLPDAKARGWNAAHFSFNTGKGRCPECNGKGLVSVPMSFLPDATTVCEACGGMRYTDDTLEVRYRDHSLGELLQRTMSEAREILTNHSSIRRALEYVEELGIGYITLGQPTYTLSGGETQRLKIARELGLREAVDTLYLLDEPTIGLHMADVDKLLTVLKKLIQRGNTVMMIEHDLDAIRAADYLIEVGPGPGAAGGNILFQGAPAELAKSRKLRTPTKPFLLSASPVAAESEEQTAPSSRVVSAGRAAPSSRAVPRTKRASIG